MQKKQTTKKKPAQGAGIDTSRKEQTPMEELLNICRYNTLLAERILKAEREVDRYLLKGSKSTQLAEELGKRLEARLERLIGALAFDKFVDEALDKVEELQRCKSAK